MISGETAPSRRWWALGAVSLAVVAVGLDGTVTSVALPTLARSLHASESDLEWFSSGYLLVLAAAMLPLGLLGDRIGRRRVMVGSLALFGVGSAACAAAPSPGAFVAARCLLGVAGAGVVVMAVSALTVLFDEAERPKAVGVWAAANFVSLPIGPILGGWMLGRFRWGWVFLLNLPVAAIGITAALLLVPESRGAARRGFDAAGVAASVAGLAALTYGLIRAGEHGFSDAVALAGMGAGGAALAAFVGWELRLDRLPQRQPLVDVRLLRSRAFTWGVVLQTVGVLAMVGVLFTLPQLFQGVRGTDALGSGVRLLPLIGGLTLGAIPAERAVRAVGARVAAATGFVLLAAGLALGATTGTGAGDGFLAVWTALVGAGMGLGMATAASASLSELAEREAGVGSALMQALNKTGGPLGTAILGSVLSSTYRARLDVGGLPPAARDAVRGSVFGGDAVARASGSAPLLHAVHAAFVQGMDDALRISAGIAAAGAVLAAAFLPSGRGRAVTAPAAVSGARTPPRRSARREVAP